MGGRLTTVREIIVRAATAELEEHGFSNFSIDRVATRSSRNKTVVYRHLGSRSNAIAVAWREVLSERIRLYDREPKAVDEALKHWLIANLGDVSFFRLLAEEASLSGEPLLATERADYYRRQVETLANRFESSDPDMTFLALLSLVSLPFVLPQVFKLVTTESLDESSMTRYHKALTELLGLPPG